MMMTPFESAIEQHKRSMLNSIRRTQINPAYVMDCFQEAYIKLSRMNTISYVEPHRVKSLFCKVASNTAIDRMRREHTQNEKLTESMQENKTLAGPTVARAREREDRVHKSVVVHRVLAELPELDSYIAWQYYAQQLSLREIVDNLKRDKGINWSHMRVKRYIQTEIFPRLKNDLNGLLNG